jgi:hypothetical protein
MYIPLGESMDELDEMDEYYWYRGEKHIRY